MKEPEFLKMIAYLLSAFPNARHSPEIIAVYWSECQGMEASLFARVAQTCVRQNTFMPSVGELLSMAEGRLTYERECEKRRAYTQMKNRDACAREDDLVGYEPRALVPLAYCRALTGSKRKEIEHG